MCEHPRMAKLDIGMAFHRTEPAGTVVARAQAAEAQGFDEFWVIEDCFYTTGVSLAAAALTATDRIGVGIGIMPVVARNAAITAMEIATLAELAPGRLHAGLGHGVQFWMAQMDANVASPLTVLEEVFVANQRLLAGEDVSVEGRYVTLDKVKLDQPPSIKPLLSAGVRGPKSLAVAGRVADGAILADFVSPNYVRWAREQMGAGDHRVTVFASLGMAPTEALPFVRAGLGAHLAEVASVLAPKSLTMASFWPELEAQARATDWTTAVGEMPDEWWREIVPFGPPEQVVEHLDQLAAAGADAVAFFPNPDEPSEDGEYVAAELLPLLI